LSTRALSHRASPHINQSMCIEAALDQEQEQARASSINHHHHQWQEQEQEHGQEQGQRKRESRNRDIGYEMNGHGDHHSSNDQTRHFRSIVQQQQGLGYQGDQSIASPIPTVQVPTCCS
jgi:hypothetical protein